MSNELEARRQAKLAEVEQQIQMARQARLAKQLNIFHERKQLDDQLLGVEVSEIEEENYTVTTDENGEIEVIQKDEE